MVIVSLCMQGSLCFTIKPDQPTRGALFYDMAPLLASPALRRRVMEALGAAARPLGATHVVALEPRGGWVGAWLAELLGVPLIVLRTTVHALQSHALHELVTLAYYGADYRVDEVALPRECLPTGARVLLVDDVLASGSALVAAAYLCQRVQPNCTLVGSAVLLEVAACAGRASLAAAAAAPMAHVALFTTAADGLTIVDAPSAAS